MRAFRACDFVSGLSIHRSWGANGRKSPAMSADIPVLRRLSAETGLITTGARIGLTLFHGWEAFIEQVLFWSEKPQPIAANLATERIHARLVAVEASEEAVQSWAKLISAK